MDLKVIFKLLSYFILCFLIVLLIEHSSQNWGRDFLVVKYANKAEAMRGVR